MFDSLKARINSLRGNVCALTFWVLAIVAVLVLVASAAVARPELEPAGIKPYAGILTPTHVEVAGIPAPADMVRIDAGQSFTVPNGRRLVITGAGSSSDVREVLLVLNGSTFWRFMLRAENTPGFIDMPSIASTLGTPSCLVFDAGDVVEASLTAPGVGNPVLIGYLGDA